MGAGYIDLAAGRPVPEGGLKQGRLGCVHHAQRPHERIDIEEIEISPNTFGLTDELMVDFIKDLDRHQVALVTAPTGSGKSTFFPYRLLEPPSSLPRDIITRHGKILVTQPRIEASSSIPSFVAESLHGAKAGPGYDIGYTNSRRKESDHRNKLVYLTDGTLLNMIKRGELYDVGTVVIDEAHERSINIDLILALLRRELKSLPHLKLIIASATIDVAVFQDYFQPDYDVLYATFPGKTAHPVIEHFADTEIAETALTAKMPKAVAEKAYKILRSMATGTPMEGYCTEEIMDGDILCFLHGKRPIIDACGLLAAMINDDDDLCDQVEVLPLYSELSDREIKRALGSRQGRKAKRWRVVISTNLAETSLTVEGIRHVVDSGLINQNVWDTRNVVGEVRPRLHSQSGLLQRRGRAGRVAPGVWHCLLTERQFKALDFATSPEIARAPLEAVLLAARDAGINDPRELRWLAPGFPQDEYARADAALRQMGALNEDGIPTALGRELASVRESIPHASLIALADSAGCVVEAATVIAADKCGGLKPLLSWDNRWPADTKLHVDRVYDVLLLNARDDLDMFIRLWAEWESLPIDAQEQWAERRFLNASAFVQWGKERERLLSSLQPKTRTAAVRGVSLALTERLRKVILWVFPDSLYQLDGNGSYVPFAVDRSNTTTVEQWGNRAALKLDSTSVCLNTKPHYLCALKRRCGKLRETPLEPPTTFVEVSFCVAFDGQDDCPTTLHGLSCSCNKESAWKPPSVLPGDRFEVTDDGQRISALSRLEPKSFITVALDEDNSADEDIDEECSASINTTAEEDTAAPCWEYNEELLEIDNGVKEARIDKCHTDALPELILVRPNNLDRLDRVIVREIDCCGKAVCEPDDSAVRLRQFAKRYPLGSKAPFVVTSIRRLRLGKRSLAIAENRETGVSVILDSSALGYGVRDVLLGQLQGCCLELVVDAIEPEDQQLEVSCVQDTIAHMSALLSGDGTTLAAQVIDADDRSIYAALLDSTDATPQMPFIVLQYDVSQMPARPADMRIGQMVTLAKRQSSRPKPRRRTFYVGDLNASDFPVDDYALEEDRIVIEGQVSDSSLKRLMAKSAQYDIRTATRLRHAARMLMLRSRIPSFRVVDVTGIRNIAAATAPSGVVKETRKDGSVVVTCDGCDVFVRASDVSWVSGGNVLEPGLEVPLFVKRAEPESGLLHASLRDPASNPYGSLHINSVIEAVVQKTGVSKGMAFALLETATGARLYLPRFESGFSNNDDLIQQLEAGKTLSARIVSVDPENERASCSLFVTEIEIVLDKGREALVAGKEPHYRTDAFRDHAGVGTFIDVKDTTVRVRSTSSVGGATTVNVIKDALSGSMLNVMLPSMGPFCDRDFLRSLRIQYGVCATITKNRVLVVAAPSDTVAQALLNHLASHYRVRSITLGRYRKEALQQARDGGLKIRFDGPFANDCQPAHLECDQASDATMLSLLSAYGIAYSDNGWIIDSRFSYELLAA
jgi:HrpA-like RNA helicase